MFNNNETQMNAGVQTGAQVDAGLRNYMLKVYNYMTVGLMITGFAGYLLTKTGLVNLLYTVENGTASINLLGILVMLAPLGLVFAISSAASKMNPQKARIMFFLFSALLGVSLMNIFLMYTLGSILKIFLITASSFGALSIYGYTTKKDLTAMGSFLIMGVFGLIIASVVNIFMQSTMLSFALSALSVLIFAGLTAYDTQKIRSMYNSYDSAAASESKAIYGALALYLDFINMFMALMNLFGERR